MQLLTFQGYDGGGDSWPKWVQHGSATNYYRKLSEDVSVLVSGIITGADFAGIMGVIYDDTRHTGAIHGAWEWQRSGYYCGRFTMVSVPVTCGRWVR